MNAAGIAARWFIVMGCVASGAWVVGFALKHALYALSEPAAAVLVWLLQ